MRSSAGRSAASSGAWLARIPISPPAVRVETWRTSPLKTSPSGVRTSTSNLVSPAIGGLGPGAGFRGDLCASPLHVEAALGQVVVLADEDLAEAAHGLGDGHRLAAAAGELLG